ncbi:MAG: hypothetical protein AAFQ53_14910 [Bacteroidota bacterium]
MRVAVLVLSALFLSACGYADPSSTSVTIAAVTVETIPEARANGTPWDPSSAPDLYIEMQDALGQVYLSTSIADAASFPLAASSPPIEVSNIERDYFFFAVEQDDDRPAREWDWIGATGSFSFADLAEERPTTLRLTNEDEAFCLELALEWE